MRSRSEAGKPSKAERAYLQGWKHGSVKEMKQGPANQSDEVCRDAYLEGYQHGLDDRLMAELHGKKHYGSA